MNYFDINVDLDDDDIALRDAAHTFAAEIMRPIARELDTMSAEDVIADGSPLWDFIRKSYELGYHKVLLPDLYGGLGLTPLQSHLVLEELSWGSVGLSVVIGVCSFPAFVAIMSGDDELIDEFAKPFSECTDGSIRGCWAITEPDHGSDTLIGHGESFWHDPNVRGNVQARLVGDEWVINGQKSAWVSCGTIATHSVLFCQIDPSLGMAGGGVCICPLDIKGVSKGKPLEKMGQRDLNQGEIYFDDVKIPKRYMICEPDFYPEMLEMILGTANAGMSIMATGCARAAFEEALVYSKERVQGGKPIIEHQSVRKRIFDMFAKVETCRALSRAVMNFTLNTSPPLVEYSIAAKTMTTQLCFEVTNEAVQMLGGNGLTREYHTEKLFRDARSALIEDGNNEVLAMGGGKVIAETYPRIE
ncbi:MAG: acyl-CoA dehydrogenase family protein [Spirochaetota bacterium]|nr:acyl-CoA dehydrogenase family protein [Spirochaetota bacterium]